LMSVVCAMATIVTASGPLWITRMGRSGRDRV
jgi:hypothetical protein